MLTAEPTYTTNANDTRPDDGRVTLTELNRRLDAAYDEIADVKRELERRVAPSAAATPPPPRPQTQPTGG